MSTITAWAAFGKRREEEPPREHERQIARWLQCHANAFR